MIATVWYDDKSQISDRRALIYSEKIDCLALLREKGASQ